MQINRDRSTGILFILVGLFFGIMSFQYKIGTYNLMGPGFFPFVLSCSVVVLGSLLVLRGAIRKESSTIHFKIPLALFVILVTSGIISSYIGILAGTIFLLIGSAMLHTDFNLKHTFLSAFVVSIILIVTKMTLFPTLPL